MEKTAGKQLLNTGDSAQAQESMKNCFCNPDGYAYEWSLITDKLTWHGSLHEKLGYNKNSFPTTLKAWEDKMIHPADCQRVKNARYQHLKTGDAFCTRYRVKQKNGNYLYLSVHGEATLNYSGTPYKWKGCMYVNADKQGKKPLKKKANHGKILIIDSCKNH